MVAIARFRRLPRWWRIGAVGMSVSILLVASVIFIGRDGQNSKGTISDSVAPGSTVASGRTDTNASGSAAFAPAATTAARPVSGSAASNAPAAVRSQGPDATGLSGNVGAPLPGDQLVIRSGALTLTVKDVAGTQAAIWTLASDLGGFAVSSNLSGNDESQRGDITIRIPAERYRDATDRLRGYAVRVEKEQSTAQDVSEEYVDLTARRKNLELTVAQLQALLGQAKTVDETLRVQTQLTSVQGDLERVKGRLNYLENRAALSTIVVTLLPVIAKTTSSTIGSWSFGHSIASAWGRSLHGLQGLVDLIIAVVVGGWWLVLPLLIAGIIFGRRMRRYRAVTPVATSATEPAIVTVEP